MHKLWMLISQQRFRILRF